MAAGMMRRERAGHTMQATALANEAYIAVGSRTRGWENTAHYFGAAANAMRRALIEYARARNAQKRGGGAQRVTFEEMRLPGQPGATNEVREAVAALAEHDARLGRLVELRYFEGYSIEEVAEKFGRSTASVKRDWSYARAWLFDYLEGR